MPDLSLETAFRAGGHWLIAGADEAGRGPLAGPVTAAAVILSPELAGNEDWLDCIDDSKRLSPAQRANAAAIIRGNTLAWSVKHIAPGEIDRIGIGPAVARAMLNAVAVLQPGPDAILFDWIHLKTCPLPYERVVKGDRKSLSIAAASILAKVGRDALMERADRCYPGYGFARHKGYPTAQHLRRLAELGPTPIHRRSFNPLRQARRPDDADAG